VTWSLSRDADEDLANLFVEGVLQFGFERAERYQAGLFSTFGLIELNPDLGRVRTGRNRSARVHPL